MRYSVMLLSLISQQPLMQEQLQLRRLNPLQIVQVLSMYPMIHLLHQLHQKCRGRYANEEYCLNQQCHEGFHCSTLIFQC